MQDMSKNCLPEYHVKQSAHLIENAKGPPSETSYSNTTSQEIIQRAHSQLMSYETLMFSLSTQNKPVESEQEKDELINRVIMLIINWIEQTENPNSSIKTFTAILKRVVYSQGKFTLDNYKGVYVSEAEKILEECKTDLHATIEIKKMQKIALIQEAAELQAKLRQRNKNMAELQQKLAEQKERYEQLLIKFQQKESLINALQNDKAILKKDILFQGGRIFPMHSFKTKQFLIDVINKFVKGSYTTCRSYFSSRDNLRNPNAFLVDQHPYVLVTQTKDYGALAVFKPIKDADDLNPILIHLDSKRVFEHKNNLTKQPLILFTNTTYKVGEELILQLFGDLKLQVDLKKDLYDFYPKEGEPLKLQSYCESYQFYDLIIERAH